MWTGYGLRRMKHTVVVERQIKAANERRRIRLEVIQLRPAQIHQSAVIYHQYRGDRLASARQIVIDYNITHAVFVQYKQEMLRC